MLSASMPRDDPATVGRSRSIVETLPPAPPRIIEGALARRPLALAIIAPGEPAGTFGGEREGPRISAPRVRVGPPIAAPPSLVRSDAPRLLFTV